MNRKQERMLYLRTIQKKILSSLYADAEKALEKAMWTIADENKAILNADTATFVYDGRWWPTPHPAKPTQCNRQLHTSLYKKVQELLDNSCFTDYQMRAGIKTFIGNFLTSAGHTDDLHRLFPVTIKANMPAMDEDIFNISEPLSDAVVKDMLDTNQINIKYLKRLLMTQLIMAKV